ncbi:hypothetical protein ACJX0J_013308 [Zea mays]
MTGKSYCMLPIPKIHNNHQRSKRVATIYFIKKYSMQLGNDDKFVIVAVDEVGLVLRVTLQILESKKNPNKKNPPPVGLAVGDVIQGGARQFSWTRALAQMNIQLMFGHHAHETDTTNFEIHYQY